MELDIFTYTATIRGEGLIVRDAAELHELLQATEIGIGDADGLFASEPFCHVFLIGIATLSSALAGYEDEFHIVALGNLSTQSLTALDGSTTGAATHAPEINHQITTWVFGYDVADDLCTRTFGQRRG